MSRGTRPRGIRLTVPKRGLKYSRVVMCNLSMARVATESRRRLYPLSALASERLRDGVKGYERFERWKDVPGVGGA